MTRPSLPSTLDPRGTGPLGSRLRVGFITHLDQHDDLSRIYRDNIRLIQGIEELGYDSAWIATRHFFSGWAALPSPYAFLGAAAVSTSRIALGTAVLPVVLDDAVRVAEDLAVIDHLSGQRLLAGLGKGVPSDSFHVFEAYHPDRDGTFEAKLDTLDWALRGNTVEGGSASIWPPAPALEGRQFAGSSNIESIRAAARRGIGLILERFGNGPERTPEARRAFQQRQADSVVEYRRVFAETWGDARTPYVITSRSAFPGTTTDAALAEASETASRWNSFAAQLGRLDPSLSVPEQFLSDNFAWGDPRALADDLLADPTVALTDELVLGIHPVTHSIDQTLEKARVLIEQVVPLVEEGWRAARAEAGTAEAVTVS
ncbi:LLM class flavin-dependent oxidoreductase [Microbacterium trichothecenolyticum]|uniref:Alkanesulfonate monooxygenase SsuD/methylene tetrahydromethanopterin reductase-like flavin-dependent oxidoreductase (Luciferase family) n=1 Tax=Microbacterium trichothecenolyticum TaxID=69370 RepID=A0ABU0TUV4_MICTR|nr:LLM class flavin-dependent oxidoreductase [Microbacterium trichothecenolyticum]MDQ1123441.1 alkanesulfonate monooxygenase SsuD/methylene tetrahydromethanopterin reductase-like flavin-dependent oxidoreductase (luciferase family) [Microbacterium trichothecenolyticum]